MKKILLAGLVLALFTTAASAQRGRDDIQRHKIEQGVRSGQLTTVNTLLNTVMSSYIMTSLGGSGGCKKGENNSNK